MVLTPGIQPIDDIGAIHNSTSLDVGQSLAGIFQHTRLALLFDEVIPHRVIDYPAFRPAWKEYMFLVGGALQALTAGAPLRDDPWPRHRYAPESRLVSSVRVSNGAA